MPVKGKANLGSNFYPKLVQISSEAGIKPEDLLAVMISESGLNPSAYESKYKGSGLIGFMPDTLRGLGYHGSWEDFTDLTGEQQLDYVKKFVEGKKDLMGGKPFTSAGQYYTANLWPIALKLPGIQRGDPNTRILEDNPSADPSGKFSKKYYDIGYKIPIEQESRAYKANPLFDRDKKGYISYGDMIKQTEINKRNPAYLKAIADMRNATGYAPGQDKEPTFMLARQQTETPQQMEDFVEKFVEELGIAASPQTSLKRLYKSSLSNNDILIEINGVNHIDAIEFSRVLCAALDEDLVATAYPHSDGHLVEIECSIAGPPKECLDAVKQMTAAVAEAFKDATSKIGGITVKSNVIMNKKSSYQAISPRTADTNHRKFLLKFI